VSTFEFDRPDEETMGSLPVKALPLHEGDTASQALELYAE
jgi:hypothetical protein